VFFKKILGERGINERRGIITLGGYAKQEIQRLYDDLNGDFNFNGRIKRQARNTHGSSSMDAFVT